MDVVVFQQAGDNSQQILQMWNTFVVPCEKWQQILQMLNNFLAQCEKRQTPEMGTWRTNKIPWQTKIQSSCYTNTITNMNINACIVQRTPENILLWTNLDMDLDLSSDWAFWLNKLHSSVTTDINLITPLELWYTIHIRAGHAPIFADAHRCASDAHQCA